MFLPPYISLTSDYPSRKGQCCAISLYMWSKASRVWILHEWVEKERNKKKKKRCCCNTTRIVDVTRLPQVALASKPLNKCAKHLIWSCSVAPRGLSPIPRDSLTALNGEFGGWCRSLPYSCVMRPTEATDSLLHASYADIKGLRTPVLLEM